MAEPRSAAEEARDPSTSPERLLELTEKHPQLQRLIVQNPSCPEVARQWILATNPWAKQEYERHLATTGAEPAGSTDDGADGTADDTADDGIDERTDGQDDDAADDTADTSETPVVGPAADSPAAAASFVDVPTAAMPRVDDDDTAGMPPADDATAAMAPIDDETLESAPIAHSSDEPAAGPASTTDRYPGPASGSSSGSSSASGSGADPAAVSAWGDYPEESVWGELPAQDPAPSTMALPPVSSAAAGSSPSVRVATDHVVPLGQATPPPPASFPGTTSAYAAGAGAAGGGAVAGAGEPPAEDDGTSNRRKWFACGGCLLLALLLLVIAVVAGRAWLADDPDEYTRDSSTTSAAPQEESPEEEETTAEKEDVSPAPEDATDMTELRSPTGNISCTLQEGSVGCSVSERSYEDAGLQDCSDGPYSVQVASGTTVAACGKTFGSQSAESLEYGESAKHGDVACTSESEGMTCWNVRTGHGFMVNRKTYETF